MTDSQPEKTAKGPLTDLRIIELGQLIAGPFCGQLMADMGADVIKVEKPGQQWHIISHYYINKDQLLLKLSRFAISTTLLSELPLMSYNPL